MSCSPARGLYLTVIARVSTSLVSLVITLVHYITTVASRVSNTTPLGIREEQPRLCARDVRRDRIRRWRDAKRDADVASAPSGSCRSSNEVSIARTGRGSSPRAPSEPPSGVPSRCRVRSVSGSAADLTRETCKVVQAAIDARSVANRGVNRREETNGSLAGGRYQQSLSLYPNPSHLFTHMT